MGLIGMRLGANYDGDCGNVQIDSIKGLNWATPATGETYFGKFGVVHAIDQQRDADSCAGTVGYALKARAYGVVDTVQTMLVAPALLATHGGLALGGALGAAATLPFRWCGPKARLANKLCVKHAWSNYPTMGVIVGQALLTPLEIFAPELGIEVLKTHTW